MFFWLIIGAIFATPAYLIWGVDASCVVLATCAALGVFSAFNNSSGG